MIIVSVLTIYLLYRLCKRAAQRVREGDPYYWIRQMEVEAYTDPPMPKSQFDERYRFLVPTEITETNHDDFTD